MPEKEFVPTDLVQRLASQGRSEQEIIIQLRSQGFTPSQVNAALSSALKRAVEQERPLPAIPEIKGPPSRPEVSAGALPLEIPRHPEPLGLPEEKPLPFSGPPPPRGGRPQIGPPPERIGVPEELRPIEIPEEAPQIRGPPPMGMGFPRSQPQIPVEELIEQIVNEHWVKIEERINVFEKRELQLQQQLQDVKKIIDDMRLEEKGYETAIVQKLDEFGSTLEKTNARIGATEIAFKEILPPLTENVRALEDLIEKTKKTK